MITIGLWYKNIPIRQIKKEWIDLMPLVGFEQVGKKVGSGYWNPIITSNDPVFLGISDRIQKHVVVDIFSKEEEIIPTFENMLKRFYQLRHYSRPVEAFLVRGVEEASGRLLTLHKGNPDKCFEGVTLPQVRVINKALYDDLAALRAKAEPYISSSVIARDNLWLDFGWSDFSSTWQIGEQDLRNF